MKQLKQGISISSFFKFAPYFFSIAIVLSSLIAPVYAEETSSEDLFKSRVISVIDGDTIRIKDGTLIRYIGIDTPELKRKIDNAWVYDPEPFAEEAAKFNQKMVAGKEVLIEVDPVQRHDKFGRLLAYVYVDKVLVNEELLKEGLAKTKTPSLFMKHRIRFWSLEEMAWTAKRGLWANAENTR
ncbi:MAG: thermonuclease family protein [Nitrospiria bacterium]